VFVEREVRDEALQASVFVLELPQAAELAHAQVRVLLLPSVERGLAESLPADVADRRAARGLAQGVGNPLLGELLSASSVPSSSEWTAEGASVP